MKSEREASTKRYQIVFSKLQAGVFVAALFALMTAFFSFGYLLAERGASSGLAGGEGKLAASRSGQGEDAGSGAVVAIESAPKKEAPDRSADVIEPEFYRDLVEEEEENEQPIDPIKLPEAKKTAPKPALPPAAPPEARPPKEAREPPRKKASMETPARKPEKRTAANPRAPKPWTAGSGYAVQVASVKKFDEALRIVRKLRRAGFQAYIRNVDLGARGRWHRVRVGRYRDRAEAQKALSEIKGRTNYRGARVIRI